MRLPSYLLLPLTAKYGLFAKLNYFLFSNAYTYEFKFLNQGKREFIRRLKAQDRISAKLRRDIHRLEKGLVMVPRRPVFAESYINDAVDLYINARTCGTLTPIEKNWIEGVLAEYFDSVQLTNTISAARRKFLTCYSQNADQTHISRYSPVKTSQEQRDWLKKTILNRRSVRSFSDEPIDVELLTEAMELAQHAPSACNRLPFKFYFTTEKSLVVEVAKCAGGTGGWADKIPALIVVAGDQSNYISERDRHLIYIDSSLASMQLVLLLEAHGISTCVINWPDQAKAERRIRKVMKMHDYERPIFLIAVGKCSSECFTPASGKRGIVYEEIQRAHN
jgi:Nitroreductase